nr:DUF2335 domain-containing protein [Ramlibacter aurantiacus]
MVHHNTTVEHSGPLPHPSVLAGYAEIVPGLPERLVQLVEQQAQHRMNQEAALVRSKTRTQERAQLFAFLLVMAIIAAATYVGINGQPWLAATMVTTTIGSVLAAFIFGRAHKEKSGKDASESSQPAKSAKRRR